VQKSTQQIDWHSDLLRSWLSFPPWPFLVISQE